MTIPEELEGCPVTTIGWGAFLHNTNLCQVTLPKSVTEITQSAFFGCTNLTQINIPESVRSIGEDTFRDCPSLTHITIPRGVEVIGVETFMNCESLGEITVPDTVVEIQKSAFRNCTSLQTIMVENSKCKIHKTAFENTVTSANIRDISPVVLNKLSVAQLVSIALHTFSQWDSLSAEEQKMALSYIKKKKTLKTAVFQSADATAVSILVAPCKTSNCQLV